MGDRLASGMTERGQGMDRRALPTKDEPSALGLAVDRNAVPTRSAGGWLCLDRGIKVYGKQVRIQARQQAVHR